LRLVDEAALQQRATPGVAPSRYDGAVPRVRTLSFAVGFLAQAAIASQLLMS
jgi:hypothetical protein